MNIKLFLDLFYKVLDKVEELYYGIDQRNNSILARYDERVFCYELYHQIRSLMDKYVAKNPGPTSSIRFQGELRKKRIGANAAKLFDVTALDNKYVPDFLLHSPGDFDYQSLIIEVKSARNITFGPIKKDLMKIQEFITRYRYQMGIFLIVNNSADRIRRLLAKPSNQRWIMENLSDRSRILFLSKENRGVNPFECYLDKETHVASLFTESVTGSYLEE